MDHLGIVYAKIFSKEEFVVVRTLSWNSIKVPVQEKSKRTLEINKKEWESDSTFFIFLIKNAIESWSLEVVENRIRNHKKEEKKY